MCILAPFRAQINTQIQEKNIKRFCYFHSSFIFFSFICLQIRCHNKMIFTFRICKHVEEVVSYKYVYFGTIRAQINIQIQEKQQKILLFSEQFYVFSFISLQIRCHNEMIFTFCICKHTEEVVSYKYFGTISCTNKHPN